MSTIIMLIWINWIGFSFIIMYRGMKACKYFLGASLEHRGSIILGLWYGLLANIAREWWFTLVLASVVRAGWTIYLTWWGMMV